MACRLRIPRKGSHAESGGASSMVGMSVDPAAPTTTWSGLDLSHQSRAAFRIHGPTAGLRDVG